MSASAALRRFWRRIPVTRQARAVTPRLAVVDAHGAASVVHELAMPPGACPVSRNPVRGTVRVSYSAPVAVEVVTLHGALAWACSGAVGAPRSVEAVAAWMAAEVSAAVGAPVVVVVDIVVRPGMQRLIVTHEAL